MGFVEKHSFWNIFRSFDLLWIMYILFLHVAIIVASQGSGTPWIELRHRDTQERVLSFFITWAGLHFWQSLLDVGMQYSLVSKETLLIGTRMVLKSIVALVWTNYFCKIGACDIHNPLEHNIFLDVIYSSSSEFP